MFKGKDKKEVAVVSPEKPEICTKENPSSSNGNTHGWMSGAAKSIAHGTHLRNSMRLVKLNFLTKTTEDNNQS